MVEGTCMEPVGSLHDLLDLQDVDAHIDRLIDQRQSLPELVDWTKLEICHINPCF